MESGVDVDKKSTKNMVGKDVEWNYHQYCGKEYI